MNAWISVFVIYVEAIIFFFVIIFNLHDCAFNLLLGFSFFDNVDGRYSNGWILGTFLLDLIRQL